MNRNVFCIVSASAVLLAFAGCSKKVTKIEPTPDAINPQVRQEIKPPVETDYSQGPDLDSRIKEVFVPIYFDYDQSTIIGSESGKLERIASFLRENSGIRVQIEGHCDERGSSEYNMGLGEKRAKSVENWLVSYGIPTSRFDLTSYGKERPAVPGCEDDGCHSKNRRDEWNVLR